MMADNKRRGRGGEIRKGLMDIDILLRMAEDTAAEYRAGKIGGPEAKGKMDYIKSRMMRITVHNENLIRGLKREWGG